MINITIEIRKLLTERGLSIEKLANEIGWSRTGLHKAMMSNSFKVETVEKIAEVLDVDITNFINNSNAEPTKRQRGMIEDLNKKISSLESQLRDKAELIEAKNKEIASLGKYKDFCESMKTALELWAQTTGRVMIGIHPLEDKLLPIIYQMDKTISKKEYEQCVFYALVK